MTTRMMALLAAVMLLAGCMSAQQKQLLAQQHTAADDTKCRGYGFQPGSPGFAQCRMSLDTAREQAA
jgi:hypothetical protein